MISILLFNFDSEKLFNFEDTYQLLVSPKKNKKLEKYNFKIKYYLFHLKYKNILKIKLFIWLLTNMFINIKLVWFI